MAFATRTPEKKESEAERFQELLRTTWQRRDLTGDAKIRSTRDILRIGREAGLTPAAVIGSIAQVRDEIEARGKTYDQLSIKYYNPYYWKPKEDVGGWTTAMKEVNGRLGAMASALGEVKQWVEYIAELENPKIRHDPNILRLGIPGYSPPTREQAREKILAALERYVKASDELPTHLEGLTEIAERVDERRKKTHERGMTLVRLASKLVGKGLDAPDIVGTVDKIGKAGKLIPGETPRRMTLSEELRELWREQILPPQQRRRMDQGG